MTNRIKQENGQQGRLLHGGIHTESEVVPLGHDDNLSEEECRILSALRDPIKGPLLYKVMEECLHG